MLDVNPTPDRAQVFVADLDANAATLDALRQSLHPTERARHERIRIERAARQFLLSRGVLRHLLGCCLGKRPRDVRLTHLAHGKPVLATADNARDLRFNLSHSHGKVVFAFTRGRDVGVDIERVRPEVRCDMLAQRFFSPHEVRTLMSLRDGHRTAAFFECWTRKEAFVKAKGTGLTLKLADFDVAFGPGTPAALLRTAWDHAEAGQWQLMNLDVHEDYAAALAVTGGPMQIEQQALHIDAL
jgi:4'-phosphopantetheinyl transferase